MPLGEPLEVGPGTTKKMYPTRRVFSRKAKQQKGLVHTKQGSCRAAKSIPNLVLPE